MSLIFKNYEFLFEFVELRNFFIMKFWVERYSNLNKIINYILLLLKFI
jgi:hypothetical protein